MIVYLITNKINGKRYVGQTVQCLPYRWSAHTNEKSQCVALNRAIQKYGKENFEIKVLSKCNSLEEMNHRENYYIKLFKTLAPYGYNLTTGGDGRKCSEETRKKMSISQKGNKGRTGQKRSKEEIEKQIKKTKGVKRGPLPKEVIEKMSLANKGRPNPMKGRKYSPEAKKNMGNHKGCEAPNKKRVLCSNGITYESAAKAARELGLNKVLVCKVASGKSKATGGFSFIYLDGDNKNV